MLSLFNPWLIVGLISALAAVFTYGHHVGWESRDDEAKAQIAAANAIARDPAKGVHCMVYQKMEFYHVVDQGFHAGALGAPPHGNHSNFLITTNE